MRTNLENLAREKAGISRQTSIFHKSGSNSKENQNDQAPSKFSLASMQNLRNRAAEIAKARNKVKYVNTVNPDRAVNEEHKKIVEELAGLEWTFLGNLVDRLVFILLSAILVVATLWLVWHNNYQDDQILKYFQKQGIIDEKYDLDGNAKW